MISIIIPVLNEAETIEALIYHLIDCAKLSNISEIIVVDGGSTDSTPEILRNISNEFLLNRTESKPYKNFSNTLEVKDLTNNSRIKLIYSKKGRAKQMNFGAKSARGDILYFLHADSFPPVNYDQHIINEVKKGNNAGCFRMQFNSKHWWLRLASWLTQFSWRVCRGGDQSQFITRALFDEIGGYDEMYTIYEDNILINELYKRNEFVVINKKIKTSARLYKRHGVWKLQYHFWAIYVKRWFGASAAELYAYYKKHIA